MAELYRTFTGNLGIDHQNGYIISEANTDELKIEFLSVHQDITDTITFIAQTYAYNSLSSWTKPLADKLLKQLDLGQLDILAQYDKDYPYIPQREHDRRRELVGINFSVSKTLRDQFKAKCKKNGVNQTEVLLAFVTEYIK